MKLVMSFPLLLSIVVVLFVTTTTVIEAAGCGGGGGGVNSDELRLNFYSSSKCSQAERLVRDLIRSKVQSDPSLAPKLLRVHYHDCFVTGCDASILLDTVGENSSEKDTRPNQTLLGFEAIDDIKAQVEQACHGIVSCADILALTVRDAVSFPFGRNLWDVPTGKRDGRVLLAGDVNGNLPSPFSDFATLKKLFSKKILNVNDLVALSGAHTIGVAHCGGFSNRLYNFTGKGDMDPTLNPTYAATLKKQCPNPANPTTFVGMDPGSPDSFDSSYYQIVKQNKGLFQSDAALLKYPNSADIVTRLQTPGNFLSEFGKSMVKMGSIEVLTGSAGEIRKNCRIIN